MAISISSEERDQLLKNLIIPPRPAILGKLMALRSDPDVNLQKVGEVIGEDLALSAAVLKAGNSPAFGRGRSLTSVPQALNLLGLQNIVGLLYGLVLRTHLAQNAAPAIEQFWDRASVIGAISAALCDYIHVPVSDCQSFALFHECGKVMMLMRYPNYARTLQLIDQATDDRVGRIEQELHGTRHDVVGYLVARVWNMPEPFAKAILLQHDDEVFATGEHSELDADGRMMVAVIRAALNVWRTMADSKDAGWDRRKAAVLDCLGLTESEYEDWRDQMHARLASAEVS
jgi:HD-like signal output (HDOD) protein